MSKTAKIPHINKERRRSKESNEVPIQEGESSHLRLSARLKPVAMRRKKRQVKVRRDEQRMRREKNGTRSTDAFWKVGIARSPVRSRPSNIRGISRIMMLGS
jgi:hypothetical protein